MVGEHNFSSGWETARAKGTDLEIRVAEYFVSQGYSCQTNVVLQGRAGSPHEVDVLATKRDGIIEHRVMIECKYYSSPVSKDVVFKVKAVRDDLSIDKAMIVCPAGFMSGAEAQAKDLGIDLWTGPDRSSMSTAGLARIVVGKGWPHAERKGAESTAGAGRGFFRKEDVQAQIKGFFECHLIRFDFVKSHFGKSVSSSTFVLTEGLEGQTLPLDAHPSTLQEIKADVAVLASRAGSITAREIVSVFEDAARATNATKRLEMSNAVKQRGLDPGWKAVNSGAIEHVLLPVIFSLRASGAGERVVVAIDMPVSGMKLAQASQILSDVSTRNLSKVRGLLLASAEASLASQATELEENTGLWTKVDELLLRGKKIQAVSVYKDITHSNLRDAKEAVEARERALRRH